MQIYLDYNASTPLLEPVRRALLPFLEHSFGNPSTTHWAAGDSAASIQQARDSLASLIHAESSEIVWTSGGTEANNHAILGTFFSQGTPCDFHIITTEIEHPAVQAPCRFLERLGATVSRVRCDETGWVDPDDIRRAIRPETRLISVMHANNEVGTIQSIPEIGDIAREHGVLLHCDAAQSVGKIPVDVAAMNVDLLSVAGHKMYAPKGIGALYVRREVNLSPLMHGAGHESGRRAGTENTPWIVALGAAATIASWESYTSHVRPLRDYFWDGLQQQWGERIQLNGHPSLRLPNTLNVSIAGVVGHELLASIPELAASTGSACHEGSLSISPVLQAMGVTPDRASGTIRFSLGKPTTRTEIDAALQLLKRQLGT